MESNIIDKKFWNLCLFSFDFYNIGTYYLIKQAFTGVPQ